MSYINDVQSCWNFAQLKAIKKKQVATIWSLKKQKFGTTMQFPEGLDLLLLLKIEQSYFDPKNHPKNWHKNHPKNTPKNRTIQKD